LKERVCIVQEIQLLRTITWLLCILALASCSRAINTLPPASQTTGPQSESAPKSPDLSYALLYRFPGGSAGSEPTGLTLYRGALYGTTLGGGAKSFGTVFTAGLGGKAHVLYSFQGGSDGAQPEGALLVLNGTLYGTTEYGGAGGDGTVFAVTPAGKERVVYSFKGGSDGSNPVLAGLATLDGTLYGTTNAGGNDGCQAHRVVGCGIVFEVSTSGDETILHRFTGAPDGALPSGSLMTMNGVLYGTTNFGGKFDDGTVFAVTTAGKDHSVYDFKGYPDGVTPFAGLTALHGALFGTTALGGAFDGSGTVFEVSTSGHERVLHSFSGVPDGALPYGALTAVGTSLYGTTELGGSSKPACVEHGIVGCGTVFTLDSSKKLRVIYRFKGHSDGASPWASLLYSAGSLYGTTLLGGNGNNGTIFKIANVAP
jgi:uncharacterized repeat protein (TIGR03803 family)